MRKNSLKLHLNDLNKSELIHLIIELANLRKENLVYLETKIESYSKKCRRNWLGILWQSERFL